MYAVNRCGSWVWSPFQDALPEHVGFTIYDDPAAEDLPDGLYSVGTEATMVCEGGYILPDGSWSMTIYCDSVFDPEIEAFVVKWRPDPQQCDLYLAYWLDGTKVLLLHVLLRMVYSNETTKSNAMTSSVHYDAFISPTRIIVNCRETRIGELHTRPYVVIQKGVSGKEIFLLGPTRNFNTRWCSTTTKSYIFETPKS